MKAHRLLALGLLSGCTLLGVAFAFQGGGTTPPLDFRYCGSTYSNASLGGVGRTCADAGVLCFVAQFIGQGGGDLGEGDADACVEHAFDVGKLFGKTGGTISDGTDLQHSDDSAESCSTAHAEVQGFMAANLSATPTTISFESIVYKELETTAQVEQECCEDPQCEYGCAAAVAGVWPAKIHAELYFEAVRETRMTYTADVEQTSGCGQTQGDGVRILLTNRHGQVFVDEFCNGMELCYIPPPPPPPSFVLPPDCYILEIWCTSNQMIAASATCGLPTSDDDACIALQEATLQFQFE